MYLSVSTSVVLNIITHGSQSHYNECKISVPGKLINNVRQTMRPMPDMYKELHASVKWKKLTVIPTFARSDQLDACPSVMQQLLQSEKIESS